MGLLQEYVFLAPYVTSLGVILAVFTIWNSVEQSKTTFEDSLSKEYREIIRKIPYNVLIGGDLSKAEKKSTSNVIYDYMDFCNEQIFLRSTNRIREKTWLNWQEGMKTNFALPIFLEISNDVFEKLPNIFSELKEVKMKKYNTDPKKW